MTYSKVLHQKYDPKIEQEGQQFEILMSNDFENMDLEQLNKIKKRFSDLVESLDISDRSSLYTHEGLEKARDYLWFRITEEENKNDCVKVGDIFHTSWGYDQTNIDYYKVDSISKTGKTCKIVKIGYQRLEETGFMSERVAPDPDNEIKTKAYDEEKREYTQIEKVQAQIRKNSDGSIWLRCGSVGGGHLWIYESPMIATHYA